MTKRVLILIFMILVLDSSLFYSQLSGSSLGKEANGYSFGISYGLSNQMSDIPSIAGWNIATSIGKTLYYDIDALFSFDLLGNLTFSKSRGLDTDAKISPFKNEILNKTDYTIFFNNHKTNLFSLGLDSKLSLNKYREEQNWYAAMSLGGNWGFYTVKMDIKDSDGKYYSEDFDRIKNESKNEKKDQLKKIMDGDYETKAEDFSSFKTRLMPSVGLEFGYDFTDYLSVFVSDKLYFTTTNNFDGETHLDSGKDVLNLANIGVNYYFHKKQEVRQKSYDKSMTDPIDGYRIPKEVQDHNYPEVKIISPEERPYNSASPEVMIKASITNIASAGDIYCKVNGVKVPFDYNSNYVQFVAVLEPGDNKIQIYAKNDYGQSRDVISIYHKGGRQEITEPEIKLISPSESVYKSDEEIFTIKAIVKYVEDKQDIKILANGQPFKSYRFDKNTNEFKIKVRLAEGQNNFEIIAENGEGRAMNSFDIYYKTDIPAETTKPKTTLGVPEITILYPTPNTKVGESDLLDFKARVSNVDNKRDITFTVNGRKNKYFDFDNSTGILTDKISLFDDRTIIKLTAKNSYGTLSSETEVIIGSQLSNDDGFKPKNDIEFTNISKPDEDCKIDIVVKIDNANSKRDLQLFLNQFEIKNFSFSKSSKLLKSTLYLDEGKNAIKVNFEHNGDKKSNIHYINCGLDGEDDTDYNNPNDDVIKKIEVRPEIILDYPEATKIVDKKDITCKATINYIEGKKDIRVSLNGVHIYNFDYDSSYNELSVDLSLLEGNNKLEIIATNEIGETIAVFNFKYEEPLAGPPSILINSPRNNYKTDENTVVFRATIENVKSTEDIYITFNGNDYTDFQFDKERGIIFTHLPLTLGKNTLRVDAENRLGSDFDEVTFQYREKILPAIKITYPKKGIIMGVAFVPLTAIVQNIKSKTGAVIYVNGKLYKSLKIVDEKLTSRVPLSQGENEIIVKVMNDYGKASDTTMVIFNGRPQKPVITFVNPSKSGKTIHDSSYEFLAKVEGIMHSSNVELTLNSTNVSDVLYYRQDKTIKASLKLRKGWNYITVIARNKTGEQREKTKIFLK